EVVVDGRVHVEATLVGVLDLMHDFPDHVVMRLDWRSLNFAIDAESNVLILRLTADRLGLSRSLPRLCGEAFDRPTPPADKAATRPYCERARGRGAPIVSEHFQAEPALAGCSLEVLPRQTQCELNLSRIKDGARRA